MKIQFAKSNRIIPFKNPPSKVELPSAGKLMKDIFQKKNEKIKMLFAIVRRKTSNYFCNPLVDRGCYGRDSIKKGLKYWKIFYTKDVSTFNKLNILF